MNGRARIGLWCFYSKEGLALFGGWLHQCWDLESQWERWWRGPRLFLSTGSHPPCSCKDGVRWFRARVPNTGRYLGDGVLSLVIEPWGLHSPSLSGLHFCKQVSLWPLFPLMPKCQPCALSSWLTVESLVCYFIPSPSVSENARGLFTGLTISTWFSLVSFTSHLFHISFLSAAMPSQWGPASLLISQKDS